MVVGVAKLHGRGPELSKPPTEKSLTLSGTRSVQPKEEHSVSFLEQRSTLCSILGAGRSAAQDGPRASAAVGSVLSKHSIVKRLSRLSAGSVASFLHVNRHGLVPLLKPCC